MASDNAGARQRPAVQACRRRLRQGLQVLSETTEVVERGVLAPEPSKKAKLDPTVIRIGVLWTKDEFVNLALQLEHPFDKMEGPRDFCLEALKNVLCQGPKVTAWKRKRWLDHWTARAKVLQDKEDALHAAMDKAVAKVLVGKRPIRDAQEPPLPRPWSRH